MTKRDIVETVYEYNENEKLIRKTVTETHEEDDLNYQTNWANIPITCESTITQPLDGGFTYFEHKNNN